MKSNIGIGFSSLVCGLFLVSVSSIVSSCRNREVKNTELSPPDIPHSPLTAMLVVPDNPGPGQLFRIVTASGNDLEESKIKIEGASEPSPVEMIVSENEFPSWKIFTYEGLPAGRYHASVYLKDNLISELDFEIAANNTNDNRRTLWENKRSWDPSMEILWTAWINALFRDCTEQSVWPSLHKVTQDSVHNFLYNFLSLGEDDPGNRNGIIMTPDCADNPFFLRAYFAWKLGLPFGYHLCDRGSLSSAPRTGKWMTNQAELSVKNPVQAFNSFLRKVMDGVHSGTARTKLEDESSDYYPVPLDASAIRPGTVYADPYGHTLVVVRREPQTKEKPGLLLAVDAQPDGTIGIRRFWKGNFLFNTSGVIGEPGFKAFRPIMSSDGSTVAIGNENLNSSSGYIPFSLQQKDLSMDDFYQQMEKIINPEPLDPEEKLSELISSLHEQLIVRVVSVSNGENFMKSHPGTIIEMPNTAAGIFQTGGLWESYSTPNRDLRLLIAMDAVMNFPVIVARAPLEYKTAPKDTTMIRRRLESLLKKKTSELTITYSRSDGTEQILTLDVILERRKSFEMAYNPNDGPEIRWGAPEKSVERSTCRRQAPSSQYEKMLLFRKWFGERLHPPT